MSVILSIKSSPFANSAPRQYYPPHVSARVTSTRAEICISTAEHAAHWIISLSKTFTILFEEPVCTQQDNKSFNVLLFLKLKNSIKIHRMLTWHESFFPSGKPAHIMLSVILFWPYVVILHSLLDMIGTVTSLRTSDVAPCCITAPQPVTTPSSPVKLLPVKSTHSDHYKRRTTTAVCADTPEAALRLQLDQESTDFCKHNHYTGC